MCRSTYGVEERVELASCSATVLASSPPHTANCQRAQHNAQQAYIYYISPDWALDRYSANLRPAAPLNKAERSTVEDYTY